jgi:hypothetical protein
MITLGVRRRKTKGVCGDLERRKLGNQLEIDGRSSSIV